MGVLGHPATGVAWLANKFAQHGARLEAGEIILAGSFTRPMWVSAGDEVHADHVEGVVVVEHVFEADAEACEHAADEAEDQG